MRVISLFSNLHAENFHRLNSANLVLVPKTEGAEAITDFRPISLIHAVAKIIAKMMASRLANGRAASTRTLFPGWPVSLRPSITPAADTD